MLSPVPFDRQQSRQRLIDGDFDLLVIGGGITGCGVALDASARGLRTALVEAEDFASGTSSRSSKLVHGGLRYLQQHDYRLVYESLHERQRLLANAPHLVHPLPFLIPLFGEGRLVAKSVAKAYGSALWLYDLTGGIRIGHRHRRISPADALAHVPVLRADRLAAAFLYWDAQADDARLTLAVARTAAAYGATLANYSPVDELLLKAGRVCGARLADGGEVRARVIVNAGGVWSETIAHLAGAGATSPVAIRPAKGIHVVVPAERLPCDVAAVLTVAGDRRSIFVVPWAADEGIAQPPSPGRFTYVGTTDTDYDGPLDEPRCTSEDVAYLLGAVNAWTTADLVPADVTGSWAGLRPLVSDARSERSADLSRRHAIVTSGNGLITVTGGKLTTYRRMAADTVDAVGRQLADRRIKRSPTTRLRLVGSALVNGSSARDQVAGGLDLAPATLVHLAGRYGSETAEVIGLCRSDPSLRDPLIPGLPYLRAEAIWAVRQEMTHSLIDLLSRRTRALMLDRAATVQAAGDVARLLAGELAWDRAEESRQLAAFHQVAADDSGLATGDGMPPSRPATPAPSDSSPGR